MKKQTARCLRWLPAAVTAAVTVTFLVICTIDSGSLQAVAASILTAVWQSFTESSVAGTAQIVALPLTAVLLFGLLTLFSWIASHRWGLVFPAVVIAVSAIVTACFFVRPFPTRSYIAFGAFCLLVWVLLWCISQVQKAFPRLFARLVNRETVSYLIFGIITTVINIVAGIVSYNTLIVTAMAPAVVNIVSTSFAWVVAVLFAYVVNKRYVFHSKTDTARAAWREFGLFIGARLLSFGAELIGMLLLVDVFDVLYGISKILMNIVVLILNYLFSKWFIFNKG